MRSQRAWFELLIRLLAALVLSVATTDVYAQAEQDETRSESESGVTVSAEVFCSETKLRTPSVRLRWSLSPSARESAKVTTLAASTQSVATTVYAGGFDKGLYVTLPVPGSTPPDPVAAVAPSSAPPMRAYQIQLIEVEADDASARAESAEPPAFTAIVENLEPGMNYTWRVTIDGADGQLVSAPITVTAPTCPADMVAPPRR